MITVLTKQNLNINNEKIQIVKEPTSIFNYWEGRESIAVDSETTGFDQFNDKLLTIQLGDSENQFVVDATTIPIIQFKELLESKLTLYHNYAFDGKWLYHEGIDVKNIYDSFLAECILTAGYDAKKRFLGLDDVGKKYLNVEISKEDRGLIHKQGLSERVILYAAKDVEHLHDIKKHQEELINSLDLQRVLELENKVARPFMLMMYNGLLINKKKWFEVSDLIDSELSKISNNLDDILIKDSVKFPALNRFINKQIGLFEEFSESKTLVNWKSPDQKKKILNLMGLNVDSVNDKTLQRNKKHEIVKEMISFSKHAKLSDTFGKTFPNNINETTGRIHSETFQIISTGRISVSNPPLQQIPSHGDIAMKIKECFIARDGYTLCDTDVGGFEIAIAAEFSQEPRWIEILNNNGDIHTETAMSMFGISREKVNNPFPERPNYSYRFVAKSISFLIIYGGNEFTLADRIQINKIKAKELINTYFDALPKLKKFQEMIANTAVQNGRIRGNKFYRRIRWFPDLDLSNPTTVASTRREAMNCPMQTTNADLIKESIYRLQDEIDKNKWNVYLLLQIHDAILDEVKDDQLQEWIKMKEEIMVKTISTYIKTVPIKLSTVTGKYWKH